jgi:hypothetical protein
MAAAGQTTADDGAAVPVSAEAAAPEEADRPWWESDPRLTDRFKGA